MKLSQREITDLVRASEWLYNEDDDKKDKQHCIRLAKKMNKFWEENNSEFYELKAN